METITIEYNRKSKAGRVLLEFVETFLKNRKGVRVKTKENEKEDVLEKIFAENDLTEKEKDFYRRYKRAVDESKAMEAGKLKDIPL